MCVGSPGVNVPFATIFAMGANAARRVYPSHYVSHFHVRWATTAMATGQRCRSLDAGLRPTLACVVDVKYSKTFIIIKGQITNYSIYAF